jgi:nucleoid-associated protein YgaU
VAQDETENVQQPTRNSRLRWTLLVLLAAGALGLAFGLWIGTQPQTATPASSVAGVSSRPTIVIAAQPTAAPPVTVGSAVVAPTASRSPVPAEREYVVQAGDTLRTIAAQEYGDPALWQRVYQANLDVIGNNPDALQPGMRLRIP